MNEAMDLLARDSYRPINRKQPGRAVTRTGRPNAFTLETQHFPDTPNHIGQAGWPSVVLNAGSTYTSETTYAFPSSGHGHYAHNHR